MYAQAPASRVRSDVRERLRRYREAGVTTLKLGLDNAPLGPARFELLENIVVLVEEIQ